MHFLNMIDRTPCKISESYLTRFNRFSVLWLLQIIYNFFFSNLVFMLVFWYYIQYSILAEGTFLKLCHHQYNLHICIFFSFSSAADIIMLMQISSSAGLLRRPITEIDVLFFFLHSWLTDGITIIIFLA